MTPADKLESLEADMRTFDGWFADEWADRLAAVRAELGETVPIGKVACIRPHGHTTSSGVCMACGYSYTTPPATVPVEVLRELIEADSEYDAALDDFNNTTATHPYWPQMHARFERAKERRRHALIAAQEKK